MKGRRVVQKGPKDYGRTKTHPPSVFLLLQRIENTRGRKETPDSHVPVCSSDVTQYVGPSSHYYTTVQVSRATRV